MRGRGSGFARRARWRARVGGRRAAQCSAEAGGGLAGEGPLSQRGRQRARDGRRRSPAYCLSRSGPAPLDPPPAPGEGKDQYSQSTKPGADAAGRWVTGGSEAALCIHVVPCVWIPGASQHNKTPQNSRAG